MMISGDSLRGIQNADTTLGVRSHNIANVNTAGYNALDVVVSNGSPRVRLQSGTPGGFSKGIQDSVKPLVDNPDAGKAGARKPNGMASPAELPNDVDLAKDMIGMQQDRRTAGYNLQALKIQDRMNGDLLDLVG